MSDPYEAFTRMQQNVANVGNAGITGAKEGMVQATSMQALQKTREDTMKENAMKTEMGNVMQNPSADPITNYQKLSDVALKHGNVSTAEHLMNASKAYSEGLAKEAEMAFNEVAQMNMMGGTDNVKKNWDNYLKPKYARTIGKLSADALDYNPEKGFFTITAEDGQKFIAGRNPNGSMFMHKQETEKVVDFNSAMNTIKKNPEFKDASFVERSKAALNLLEQQNKAQHISTTEKDTNVIKTAKSAYGDEWETMTSEQRMSIISKLREKTSAEHFQAVQDLKDRAEALKENKAKNEEIAKANQNYQNALTQKKGDSSSDFETKKINAYENLKRINEKYNIPMSVVPKKATGVRKFINENTPFDVTPKGQYEPATAESKDEPNFDFSKFRKK